eukprot:116371-Rhodomonas_salina.1
MLTESSSSSKVQIEAPNLMTLTVKRETPIPRPHCPPEASLHNSLLPTFCRSLLISTTMESADSARAVPDSWPGLLVAVIAGTLGVWWIVSRSASTSADRRT